MARPIVSPVAGNQSQYASHRKARGLNGGSAQRVSQRVKAGDLGGCIRPDGLIDFAAADAMWDERTSREPIVENAPQRPQHLEAALSKDKLALEKEKLVAQIEELELKNARERGSLVKADEVLSAQTQRAEAERESWLNWPAQVSSTLAAHLGLSEREVFLALDAAVRAHLEKRSQQPIAPSEAT